MAKCRECGLSYEKGRGHHPSCSRWREESPAEWGVFPHAEWSRGRERAEETGRGFVVRAVGRYVPYSRMTPVRIFPGTPRGRAAADRLADKLSFGPGGAFEGTGYGRDRRRRSARRRRRQS